MDANRVGGRVGVHLQPGIADRPARISAASLREVARRIGGGMGNLLELAARCGEGFLQVSISECCGDPLEHPQKERTGEM